MYSAEGESDFNLVRLCRSLLPLVHLASIRNVEQNHAGAVLLRRHVDNEVTSALQLNVIPLLQSLEIRIGHRDALVA